MPSPTPSQRQRSTSSKVTFHKKEIVPGITEVDPKRIKSEYIPLMDVDTEDEKKEKLELNSVDAEDYESELNAPELRELEYYKLIQEEPLGNPLYDQYPPILHEGEFTLDNSNTEMEVPHINPSRFTSAENKHKANACIKQKPFISISPLWPTETSAEYHLRPQITTTNSLSSSINNEVTVLSKGMKEEEKLSKNNDNHGVADTQVNHENVTIPTLSECKNIGETPTFQSSIEEFNLSHIIFQDKNEIPSSADEWIETIKNPLS